MENILLKNAELFCPHPCGVKDVLVSKGQIQKIGTELDYNPQTTYVLDCSGDMVCPMFVDGNALIVGKLIYSEKDFLAGGIGTVVGTMRFGCAVKNLEAYLEAANKLKLNGLDCFILTDGIDFYTNSLTGDISTDIATINGIIGAKTALSSKGVVRLGNPTFSMFQELAVRCYSVSRLIRRPVQLMVHLERELKPHTHNLAWIDKIVEDTGVPYSTFKLLHAEEYAEDVLKYAQKGCYVDFTAFEDKYDPRYDNLVSAMQTNDIDLDRISISSNAFDLVEKHGNFAKYCEPKNLLNTIKILCLEKGLKFADVIKLVTSTPSLLIGKDIASLEEGKKCKALILDKQFNIKGIIDYKNNI